MPRLWRYKRDGHEFGPVTPDDLQMLAKAERLLPTDLVCKDGTNHWFAARGIRGLFPKPTAFGRFMAWIGPTGLVATLLAVLLVGVGLAFLIYAIYAPHTPTPAASDAQPPTPAASDAHHHTHLLKALHEMREAHGELRDAGHDFGGHLDETTRTLDHAIDKIENVLKTAGVNVDEAPDASPVSKKYKDHPHINSARDEIIEARTEINDSKDDLGNQRDVVLVQLTLVADQLEVALKNAK